MSGSEETTKRFLLYFGSGPIHRIEDNLVVLARTLNRHYSGLFVIWGNRELQASFGDIRIVRVRGKNGGGILSKIARLARMLSVAYREARKTEERPIIIAYDPLANGLVALITKWATGSSMICQVNGVHWDPAVLGDIDNILRRRVRQQVMMKVAQFVLNRSEGIRPLFPAQLEGYRLRSRGQVVRSYFNLVAADRFVDLGEQPIVLFVGYPFELKGVDVLIKAFVAVRNEFPRWRLQLLGFELEQHVDQYVEDRTRIEVLPAASNEAVAGLVGKCGIFVLPSRTEGMGRVLLEAGAAAKPRIGSRVGGIPTVIEDGVDGLLFPSGDVSALASLLRRLMSSRDERRHLGEAAQKRVQGEFSPARFLARFDEHVSAVYDGAASEPSDGPEKP